MSTNGKSRRGFASMDPAKVRAIASQGGKAAHAQGRAHEYTSEEARAAGRKGGLEAHRRGRAHEFTAEEAQAAGRKGGRVLARKARRRRAVPCCQCDAPARTRGLCTRCYNRCQYQVDVGKTTWQALEAAGLARPRVRKRQERRQ
jgi:general stress protein YciG